MVGQPNDGNGGGRPRNVKPLEVLREKVEAEVDIWLAPYREAVTGATKYFMHEGDVALEVPDLGARMAAAEKVFDRLYGRPTQAVEHSGPDGGPINIASLAEAARNASSQEDP